MGVENRPDHSERLIPSRVSPPSQPPPASGKNHNRSPGHGDCTSNLSALLEQGKTAQQLPHVKYGFYRLPNGDHKGSEPVCQALRPNEPDGPGTALS